MTILCVIVPKRQFLPHRWDDARAQLVARYSQPFALAKYRSPLDQVVEQFVTVAEPNEDAPSV
jgi:hypothetical protein